MSSKRVIWTGIALVLSTILLGCSDQDANTPVENNITNEVLQDEKARALALVLRYFGGEMIATSISRGPAGSFEVKAKNKSNGSTHTLFILADQQHLIDGSLYSPRMSKQQISDQHSRVTQSRVVLTEQLDQSKEKMRQKIADAITQNKSPEEITEITESAIKERVSSSSSAARTHNDNIVSTLTNEAPKLQTASLPRNNTVVDTESIYKRIEQGNWISTGSNKKVLYIFHDFRCPQCAKVHQYLADHIKKDTVDIRFLPVGALGQDSLVRASLSLIPKDNEDRLKLMETLEKPDEISLLIKTPPSQEDLRMGQIAALENLNLLIETQRVATPTFAYRTQHGAVIKVITSFEQLERAINSIIDS